MLLPYSLLVSLDAFLALLNPSASHNQLNSQFQYKELHSSLQYHNILRNRALLMEMHSQNQIQGAKTILKQNSTTETQIEDTPLRVFSIISFRLLKSPRTLLGANKRRVCQHDTPNCTYNSFLEG